jgi:hypothetical protein
VKPPNTIIQLMLLEDEIFIQLISNFKKSPDFLFGTKFSSSCLSPLGSKQR